MSQHMCVHVSVSGSAQAGGIRCTLSCSSEVVSCLIQVLGTNSGSLQEQCMYILTAQFSFRPTFPPPTTTFFFIFFFNMSLPVWE